MTTAVVLRVTDTVYVVHRATTVIRMRAEVRESARHVEDDRVEKKKKRKKNGEF